MSYREYGDMIAARREFEIIRRKAAADEADFADPDWIRENL